MGSEGHKRLGLCEVPCPPDRGKDKPHLGASEAAKGNSALADLKYLCARRIIETQEICRPSAMESNLVQCRGGQSPGFLHAPDSEQFRKEPDYHSFRLRRGLR
jgi:hypothetical protein